MDAEAQNVEPPEGQEPDEREAMEPESPETPAPAEPDQQAQEPRGEEPGRIDQRNPPGEQAVATQPLRAAQPDPTPRR